MASEKTSGSSYQDIQEELAFLRHKCTSLSMRGHYTECIKTIEENLKAFYFKDRWPENCFSMLRLHQKCYPSLNKDQPHDEYLTAVLKKNGIPFVLAQLLRTPDNAIAWSAEYFRDLALARESESDYDAALAYCDLILKIEPGSSNAYLMKGRFLEHSGRENDALKMLEQALELNPGNRHALGSLARHYMHKEPAKALGFVEQAIEQLPGEAANFALKAEVLQCSGRLDEARQALDEAMRLDPYNPEYPYRQGELLVLQDKQVKAVPQYRLAIALDEKHIPSLLRLAEFSAEHQPAMALDYITKVVDVDPAHRDASLLRARLLKRLGNREGAIAQYKAHLELDPGCHEAMGALGSLYLALGNAEIALSYLDQALVLAGDVAAYNMDKAEAHQKLGQPDEAIAGYKKVLSLDKKSARAWGQLGFLTMEKNPREAIDYFSKAIALDGENAAYYAAKGELVLKQPGKSLDDALPLFDEAVRHDPGNPDLHCKLAQLLESVDHFASAVEHYRAALHMEPENPDAHYHLSRLLLDTHPALALYHITIAIQLSVIFGEYYFFKARVVDQVGENPQAIGQLMTVFAKIADQQDIQRELLELREGDYMRVALKYLNRAIELSPDVPAYLCSRAYLLYRLGQKSKALAQFEKLLKENPNQHEALFGMARIYADKTDERAVDYFDRAIAGAPAEPDYHAEKAYFLVELGGRYDEALQEFTAAINLNKQAWTVVLQKARLLDAHGDREGARTEYRHVLLVNRTCLEATARMGQLLADLSPAHAAIYLDQAIRLDGENSAYYALRSKVLYALGQEERAGADAEKALELEQHSVEALYRQASLLLDTAPENALAYGVQVVGAAPENIEYHLLLGRIYTALHQYAEARRCFDQAAELDQKSHEMLENKAELAYIESGKSALKQADAALASRPDCPACLFTKARVLDRQSDYTGALDCINRAIALEPDSLPYRELMVDLLRKKRALLKYPLEKAKLEKFRKQLEQAAQMPEPPDFSQEELSAPEPPSPPENAPQQEENQPQKDSE